MPSSPYPAQILLISQGLILFHSLQSTSALSALFRGLLGTGIGVECMEVPNWPMGHSLLILASQHIQYH